MPHKIDIDSWTQLIKAPYCGSYVIRPQWTVVFYFIVVYFFGAQIIEIFHLILGEFTRPARFLLHFFVFIAPESHARDGAFDHRRFRVLVWTLRLFSWSGKQMNQCKGFAIAAGALLERTWLGRY